MPKKPKKKGNTKKTKAALAPEIREAVESEVKKVLLGYLGLVSVLAVIGFIVALHRGYTAAKDYLKDQISTRLDTEFSEPTLKATVHEAAQKRANAIIEEQVAPAVANFREDVNDFMAHATAESERLESELAHLSTKIVQVIEKHSSLIHELTLVNEYTQTVINAEAGYRKAYDQLLMWADDKTFPMAHQAFETWKKITSSHNPVFYKQNWSPSTWYDDGDPSTLSLSELVDFYRQQEPLSFRRIALIDYLYQRKDIPKSDKMKFFIEVIEKDDSLDAVEYAGRYFGTLAGLKLHPLAVEGYLKWWKQNTLEDAPKQ